MTLFEGRLASSSGHHSPDPRGPRRVHDIQFLVTRISRSLASGTLEHRTPVGNRSQDRQQLLMLQSSTLHPGATLTKDGTGLSARADPLKQFLKNFRPSRENRSPQSRLPCLQVRLLGRSRLLQNPSYFSVLFDGELNRFFSCAKLFSPLFNSPRRAVNRSNS